MPPYTINRRITTGKPNHPNNHKPASKIDYPYRIPPPDRNAPEYRGSKNAEKYAQHRYHWVELSSWNDTEEGQAERREEEEERARKKMAEKKQQKEEKKIDKEKDKKYKKSGESSKGQNEERHRLLGGSRGR
ncbi:hypothetical protein ACHAP3_000304 [Botrytis cinerea]|uniref:Uncharacterized protein n=1 Tax=Botryotinia fuckeliana (strain BcDW1) TaxID=1290391 RepID=M7TVX1_BOTF1|nr:hypothetical protein BcDW1_3551 [Botrytis cinerea BcDW1]